MGKHEKFTIAISVVYIVGVCAYMISHRLWFSPDQFFVFALFCTILIGRVRLFLIDWVPFLSLFFGYEFLRGLVPSVTKSVHIIEMIHFDQAVLGFVPTIKLQSLFYNPAHLHWYDYLLVTLYICHFVTPMVVGFVLWLKDRALFKEYTLGLLILSYAAFVTYVLFPAMPPWMASSEGYLPPIKEVTGVVMSHFLTAPGAVPTIYSIMRPNAVAAIPSLHAAYPFIILLFLMKKFGKKGLLFLPYFLGVSFAVMYLGEHYFADIVIGVIYASTAFAIVVEREWILKKARPIAKKIGLGKLNAFISDKLRPITLLFPNLRNLKELPTMDE